MRVLICGGRDFTDWPTFRDKIEEIALKRFPRLEEDEYGNFLYNVTIISGAAQGADTLAIDWAITNWCPYEEYPANWKKYGRKAGPIRNQQMLDEGRPDLVIAFPTEKSKGTYDMIRRARKAGVEVVVYGPSEWT